MALDVFLHREAVAEGHLFPQTGRLIRQDAVSADLVVEQPAGGQRIVADDFGRKPVARAARQQAVFWVFLAQFGSDLRRLTVRRRGHDQFLHRLHVPAGTDEFRRQPVEQFGMDGRLALRAEILDGFDNAVAEIHLPETIDRDARGQRMIRIDKPSGQCQTVDLLVFLQRRKNCGDSRRDILGLVAVIAAREDECVARFAELHHDHRVEDRLVQGLFSLPDVFQLGVLPPHLFRRGLGQEIFAQPVFFLFRPLAADAGKDRADRKVNGQVYYLTIAEIAGIKTHVIKAAAICPSGLFAPDDQFGAGFDRAVERVLHDLDLGEFAVQEDLQSGGPARSVVSEGQMLPIVVVERFFRANDNRVVWPGGDQPEGQRRGPLLDAYQMRVLKNQFVPAPRLLVFYLLESEIADLAYSGAHPEREGKLIASVERAGVAETQHSLAVQ